MELNVNDEISKLESVILGIAQDIGSPLGINAKQQKHIREGTTAQEHILMEEVAGLQKALEAIDVQLYRPKNILPYTLPNGKLSNSMQMYTRDIGFVIHDKFVKANMLESARQYEFDTISHIVSEINPNNILLPPDTSTIEGGDVVLYPKKAFVALGNRTNQEGYFFLKDSFPELEIIPFALNFNAPNEDDRILHLDCAFQPVGDKYALICENAFIEKPIAIYDLFGEDNLIKVTPEERCRMFPNILSVSPDRVISEKGFTRLNHELRKKGIEVIELKYSESSKQDGLFRCSTLPLYRKK